MRVLITGGSGFIGSALGRRLTGMGMEVVVADLRPSRDPRVTLVQGDLRDAAVVEEALQPGTEAVVHLAAFTSVLKSLTDPHGVYRTNLEMTANLLERARLVGARRFVFASTNAIVGDVGRTPIHERMPLEPLTPYGATKAAAEMLMSAYTHAYGVRGVALRLTNVYGTGMQHKDSIVPRLMRAALQGGSIDIYGDGEQVRDYIYLDDVVEAFVLALTRDWIGPVTIGFGESVSVNTLHALAREATGRPIGARYVDPKPGEMPAVVVDTSYARSLGFRPETALTEGLRRVWEDFRARPA
ncbi:UDP-glucose 4-epimerase [Candidatus Hydrogenisulfobacillus filiaventi]|uniref:UDP-glucose 4-epimerase n=1 Tax=Candidatus Hydrogenisulfobacillus filiaventi TaxID=2707344 RepID=A0A6F8ZIP8_9FIRM|nr:UDP-glucose 4-epimerase [Candidatus Hydrogenisulfobacillus filiaventi]